MKIKSLKVYVLGLIILILGSTIISSAGIITKNTYQKPLQIHTNIAREKTNIDQKIMNILEMINETLLRNYLKSLVEIGHRMTGTYGCEKAAKYIFEQFEKLDLNPRYHDWTAFGDWYHKGHFKGQNVEATLKGKDSSCDEILVFNAHYDTVRPSPGANDDGSGTAAVLTAAYVLSQFEFNRTIKFIAFSGEEVGLIGSRAYTKEIYTNDENILYEFNADMIGHARTGQGGRNMGVYTTEDALWIIDLFKDISNDFDMNFELRSGQIDRDAERGWSDYWPFVQYGYEAIACWGSSDGDPNYHKPTDNLDNINFSYLVNTTRHIVGALAYLADFNNPYPQIKIANPKKGRLYYKDRIKNDFRFERTIVINDVHIYAEVKPGAAPINRVEFYYDDKLECTVTELPFEWWIKKLSIREHNIDVVVYDELGYSASDSINFFFLNINNRY